MPLRDFSSALPNAADVGLAGELALEAGVARSDVTRVFSEAIAALESLVDAQGRHADHALSATEVVSARTAGVLGDFTKEPVAGEPAAADPALGETTEEDYENESVDVLGNLVAELLGDLDETRALNIAHVHVLAQLRDLGHYHVGALRPVEGGFEVDLTCERPPREDELLLTPTPVVLEGPLEINGRTVQLRVSRAGADVDESPSAVVNEIVDEIVRDLDEDEDEIEVPATLVVTFRRDDGVALTDDDLAAPVEEARRALAYRLGSVRTSVIEPAGDDAMRRVVYALDGGGELDARGLSLALVSFRGTRVFEGLGAVTCANE